jgi:hypothetical protein
MGCFSRIGCLTFGVLLGAVGLALLLATRPVGPRVEGDAFVYEVGGRERAVRLSEEAARSFDQKVSGRLPPESLLEAVTAGVPVSEEELNSRIAEELARQPLGEYGAGVDRVFVRLTSAGATAYVYSTVRDVPLVLRSDLVFRIEPGSLAVELRDPHVGRLPVGFALPSVLSALNELRGLEERIALVIPPQVRAIRHEEGRMRVLINPLAGRAAP